MNEPNDLKAPLAPPMSSEEVQKILGGQIFPKVTPESIKARITKVDYLTLPDSTVTLCNITIENGFSVRGESACVDPRNFNQEVGKTIAYRNAFDKLWALEGYLLAERRFVSEKAADGVRDTLREQTAINQQRPAA